MTIANGMTRTTQRVESTEEDKQAQPDETSESLGHVQGDIPNVEDRFDGATLNVIIKTANPQSNKAGPFRPRYRYPQAALCEELVGEIQEFAKLGLFQQESSPNILDTAYEG